MRPSKTRPLTAAEAAFLRRVAKFARLAGIASGVAIVVAALLVAVIGDWASGLIFVGVAVLIVLNFSVYVPWIFDRIIRKRGVVAG